MFQTDSDEDVIFVSSKCALKSNEITLDQAKRLALQRDIDQQSQPKQLAKPLTSQRSVAVERPLEMVKMKMEGEENVVKKEKKLKIGQVSLLENRNSTVDDGSLAKVKKEKKKSKKVDTIIIEDESCDGGGEKEEKRKKKRKIVTETLNDADEPDAKNGNDEKVRKKKKQQQLAEHQVETALSAVKEEEMGKNQRKKVKKKSVQMKPENKTIEKDEEEEQQAGKDKLSKKAKKTKNYILVESSEETEEQVKEKKKKKKTEKEATEGTDETTKKKNKAKTKVAENDVKLETSEGETGAVEEVKVKKKKKKEAKRVKVGNEEPQIKGNNKSSKVEKHTMLNKKDKSTESEIVIIDERKTELKKKGKKDKSRKASVEVSEVEDTVPKKKKRKNREKEEPFMLKCEEVEVQSTETLVTVAGDSTSKKSKRKKSSIKVETHAENVSFETSAKKKMKKKMIKEEVEDQHESPQVDVVFLSEKTGNSDEVTINQERRQALQMEIDQASQPQKPAKPTGFGQWSTAQFDSSDQQQKFLRLMGGFKKGFQPATGSTGGANMALGKEAQQQLQQGLLGEFERAHSRRVDFSNRGAGLGFAAPSNKKFSIDINTRRSVRFDD